MSWGDYVVAQSTSRSGEADVLGDGFYPAGIGFTAHAPLARLTAALASARQLSRFPAFQIPRVRAGSGTSTSQDGH